MTTAFTRPALQFTQSGRRSWTTTFTVRELAQLKTRDDPDQQQLFTEFNRPINARHLGALVQFLSETPNWALPPLILSAQSGELTHEGSTLSGDLSALRILDGQHRIQAFSDLQAHTIAGTPEESAAILTQLNEQAVAATIIEVANSTEHRQIFGWYARDRNIDPATREYFDQSDPYSNAARVAAGNSAVLHDRLLLTANTIPARGPDRRKLLTLRQLKELAITIHLGISRNPTPSDRDTAWLQDIQQELAEKLTDLFDKFLPSCTPNYDVLNSSDNRDLHILQNRSVNYALDPMVMKLFVNAWARHVHDRGRDPQTLAAVTGRLNLRRADPQNDVVTTLAVADPITYKFAKARTPPWDTATTKLLELAQTAQSPRKDQHVSPPTPPEPPP